MDYGRIIFLNGASSSGKTTIAQALQTTIGKPFWHVSIDKLREAGVLPLERYKNGEFNWSEDREAFFRGFHLSLRAYVEAGNDLIVEHIIETQEWKKFLVTLLEGVDVFFVGIHCPLEELERREAARKDRKLGEARKDMETIHHFNTYDLELDGTASPEENVALLLSAWDGRTSSTRKWVL